MPRLVALLHGPDKPGLVAQVAGWIFQNNGTILHADQHCDDQSKIFFQRVEWTVADDEEKDSHLRRFPLMAEDIGMQVQLKDASIQQRVAIMVSTADHCFHDLALRFRSQEISGQLVSIVSNHTQLQASSEHYGIPFTHIPINADSKPQAEAQLQEHLLEQKVDLLILARYMQILSQDFLQSWPQPVINIHHSFLPAFAGGKPYHQAHSRGVKIIGATAHYATEDLDEGPIIQQDVTRITHRHNVKDLIRKGRDLERTVLAQAIHWHLEHRILAYNNKTVVFA